MKAIIPVAGYATRMYPLTENMPKALLEVAGKPMMEHVFEKISELKEIEQVVVVSNHKYFERFREWAEKFGRRTKIPILVIDDGTASSENRLGAIGDAQFAVEKAGINGDLLWISGDNLFTFSLKEMQKEFEANKTDLIACYDVRDSEETKKMSEARLDSENRVVFFEEKPQHPETTQVSIGIYFYTAETVRLFKKYLEEGNSPDKPGEFVQWLYKQKPVFAKVFGGKKDFWFDIGSLQMFEHVKIEFAKLAKK